MERRDTEIVRDDATGTVREESHVSSADPAATNTGKQCNAFSTQRKTS